MPQNLVRREHISNSKGLSYILSDESIDRYGDIIRVTGWILTQFERNPVALFGHNPNFPIGVWSDVRIEAKALRGELKLAPKGTSARIDEIHSLIDHGVLRSVSVGFEPISYEERKGEELGLIYTEQELIECSLVAIPANPNALQVAKALKISTRTQDLVFNGLGKAKLKLAAKKKKVEIRSEEDIDDAVEMCVLDLMNSELPIDEDEAREICQQVYGEE